MVPVEQNMVLAQRPRPDSYHVDALRARLAELTVQVQEFACRVERDAPSLFVLDDLARVITSARVVRLLVLEAHLRHCLVEDDQRSAACIADIRRALDACARVAC